MRPPSAAPGWAPLEISPRLTWDGGLGYKEGPALALLQRIANAVCVDFFPPLVRALPLMAQHGLEFDIPHLSVGGAFEGLPVPLPLVRVSVSANLRTDPKVAAVFAAVAAGTPLDPQVEKVTLAYIADRLSAHGLAADVNF